MTLRLNARIDRVLARKVAYLRARTQSTTTEVVKASIEAMFDRVSREQPLHLLADFVGSASGASDLSQTYKEQLTQSFARNVSADVDETATVRNADAKPRKRKPTAPKPRKKRARK